MKQLLTVLSCLVFCLTFMSCKNETFEQDNKKLLADNNRLVKEMAQSKLRYDSLKMQFDDLNKQFTLANSQKDTLLLKINKQAQFESLRKRAESMPLELSSITIQNENDKEKVLKVKGPFKKSEARFISFKGTATNNAAKMGKKLSGRIMGVYRLGTLVQQMKNTSGTFTGDDGLNKIYTHSWDIASDKESIPLDKGIGDKTRGIFQAGHWTLELWFEPKGANRAYKLAEGKFEIL